MTRNITGIRFGRLVANSYHHSLANRRYWECKCDCGNLIIVRQDQLTTGKTMSCGCYGEEVRRKNLVLGRNKKKKEPAPKIDQRKARINPLIQEYPRIHNIWSSMKSRCYYPRNKCYKHYGGRGISVCEEWRNSYTAFAMWAISNGYKDDLSIDRIDVNGNYEPSNCRWATNSEQQKNKRKRTPSA